MHTRLYIRDARSMYSIYFYVFSRIRSIHPNILTYMM